MNLKKESLKRGPGFPVSKHCNKISRNLVLDQQYMFPGSLVGWKQDPTRDYMHVIPSTSLGISPGLVSHSSCLRMALIIPPLQHENSL